MCGDGTNDVGALKHAHVGVSILSNTSFKKKKTSDKAITNESNVATTKSSVTRRGESVRAQDRHRPDTSNMTPRERAIAKHRENLASTQEIIQQVRNAYFS